MLIAADLSGIQEFLFHVRDEGGGQAATLRARSFRIQLFAEVLAQHLLSRLRLTQDALIFCSAGKVLLRCATSDANLHNQLATLQSQWNHWLLVNTHGLLRLSLSISDSLGSEAQQHQQAMQRLATRKLQSWQPAATQPWSSAQLVADGPMDWERQTQTDESLGHRLRNDAQWWAAYDAQAIMPDSQGEMISGLQVRFFDKEPPASPVPVFKDRLRSLLRHIPRDDHGKAVEFVDLAAQAQGAPMLAVLKADADALGESMKQLLESQGLSAMQSLSTKLETFFGAELDRLMRSDTTHGWSKLYTIFSGGDDLLLVGPWNIVLDFAGELRNRFELQFGTSAKNIQHPPLTLSAGVSLLKPKYPIRLAAQQAEDLLHQAKYQKSPHATTGKDQCAALGGLWKWSNHALILGQAKQLTQWVAEGIVERGWLHTLLQLTLLRRGQIPNTPQHEQLMATARLTYHVGRNWPKATVPGEKGKARQWIDRISREFDRYETTRDVTPLHLPVILRYAMLATRSANEKE